MIEENTWRRPVYFTEAPGWLTRHCRIEGIVSHLLPVDTAQTDCNVLRRNLMERYRYDGYTDSAAVADWMNAHAARRYAMAFDSLIACAEKSGDMPTAQSARARLQEHFPWSGQPMSQTSGAR